MASAQRIAKHADIDEVVAIGPPMMMKACAEATRPHKIKTMVSVNPIMVDGTGMCGGCRVKIGDQVKFACVDGPDFDGHQVDFDDLMARLRRYKKDEREATERWSKDCRMETVAGRACDPAGASSLELLRSVRTSARRIGRREHGQEEDDPHDPAGAHADARADTRRCARKTSPKSPAAIASRTRCARAERCLLCPDQPCVRGCPVGIDIPGFIQKIGDKDYRGAYDVITDTNLLPAVCGRVCPQESQCEGVCTVGETLEPVAIGRLERFVGDTRDRRGLEPTFPTSSPTGFRSASSAAGPPAWRAPPTWRRPAARSPSTRPSTSPAAC